MSQQYIRGPVCGVDNCPSRLYRSTDGQRICQYGHVVDGDLEFGDDDDNFAITRKINLQYNDGGNLVHKSNNPLALREKSLQLSGGPAKECHIKCLQIVLKKLLYSIVEQLYNNDQEFLKQVERVVKVNWAKFLDGLLSPYSINSYETDRNGKEIPQFNVKPTTKVPNSLDTLFIIYFSILQLDLYPIYLSDLVDLVLSGKIALLKTLHLIPLKLLYQLPYHYTHALQVTLFTPDTFMKHYSRVAKKLCPSQEISITYYYPYIFKTFFETLLLPNSIELFVMVNNLSELLKLKLKLPLTRRKNKNPYLTHILPEVMVTCFMILVIKIHFIYQDLKIDYTQWFDNLSNINIDNDKFEFLNKYDKESIYNLVNWSESKINNYCNYLNALDAKHEVSLQLNKSYQGSVMINRLYQIFDDKEDSNQYPIEEESNLNKYLQSYASENIKTPHKKDIHIIEDLLFKKFAQQLMVLEELMFIHYQAAEELLVLAVRRATK